ncbi:MAG: hypothetical protein D6704_09850, partial [Nitrospirae bacterium]
MVTCRTAEHCFKTASSLAAEQPEQIPQLLAAFEHIRTAYPGTIWSRRAGIRLGLLLMERDPEQALS